MSNSALLKSGLVKKYWMALTGLFLCLFLLGHLAGNLQLLMKPDFASQLQFNSYGTFMVSNPFIIVLSWLTYISIIFHAIDGIVLTVQNRLARKSRYVMSKPSKNSTWTSRYMSILGLIILVFIIIHMSQFWYAVHFGGLPYMHTKDGTGFVLESGRSVWNATIVNGMVVDKGNIHHILGTPMDDLWTPVYYAFTKWWWVIIYVVALLALAFHLSHGVQSAFQSLGIDQSTKDVTFYKKYRNTIKKFGIAFCIIIPVLFAIIPVILYFRQL